MQRYGRHGKAAWDLRENDKCCFEQMLEATYHKTAAEPPLTSWFTNHSLKTNTCGKLPEKLGRSK